MENSVLTFWKVIWSRKLSVAKTVQLFISLLISIKDCIWNGISWLNILKRVINETVIYQLTIFISAPICNAIQILSKIVLLFILKINYKNIHCSKPVRWIKRIRKDICFFKFDNIIDYFYNWYWGNIWEKWVPFKYKYLYNASKY